MQESERKLHGIINHMNVVVLILNLCLAILLQSGLYIFMFNMQEKQHSFSQRIYKGRD